MRGGAPRGIDSVGEGLQSQTPVVRTPEPEHAPRQYRVMARAVLRQSCAGHAGGQRAVSPVPASETPAQGAC